MFRETREAQVPGRTDRVVVVPPPQDRGRLGAMERHQLERTAQAGT